MKNIVYKYLKDMAYFLVPYDVCVSVCSLTIGILQVQLGLIETGLRLNHLFGRQVVCI